MEQNRLLLLGLLQSQEQHGYQIIEFIEKNLSRMTNLKRAAAYYELKKLEKERLVDVRVEQDPGRPPRRIYSLTEEGEGTFMEMLRESLSEADPLSNAADVGLMFVHLIDPAEAQELLTEKVVGLQEHLQVYEGAPAHTCGFVDLAIGHIKARLAMEIDWYLQLIETIPHYQQRISQSAGVE